MPFDLSAALEERWAEYLRLREQNAHFDAFVRLGAIANCTRYAQASSELRSKWSGILEQIDSSTDVLRSIKPEALEKIRRLERIVGIGSVLTYEEALLVIKSRVEIDMLISYLAERGVMEFVDFNSIDDQLQEAASSLENSPVFRSARQAAKRNWGLPLRSQWLGSDAMH